MLVPKVSGYGDGPLFLLVWYNEQKERCFVSAK